MIVIVGGGWAGCAAAFSAAMAGARVTLLEKTDMLLGTGLVGGIMRNNGRFTAFEELWAMGAGNFLRLIEGAARHRWLNFPGHRHAMLYDVTKIEPVIRSALQEIGVSIYFQTRINNVVKSDKKLTGIVSSGGNTFTGDVFIDCTGSAGPTQNCTRYGMGCAMCILRCPTFGPRVSLTARAGIEEITAGENFAHFEAMSGSCKLDKKSLTPWLVDKLERDGVLVIPLPGNIQKKDLLSKKACQQYNLSEFASNLIILDTGHAKLMTPYFPLDVLRSMEGFKEARYADPYSGGMGNSIRFMAMAPCDDSLRVEGIDNLYCAGEKTGLLVGHTEAIATGFLAGHNAARQLMGLNPLALPDELATGDIIGFMHREMKTREGLQKKYTFSGSVYFQRMQERGLYATDPETIRKRVGRQGMSGIFSRKIIYRS